ncbi:hypothetical protein HPB50_024733 [Hyalomma asiaticum]|uniref:Uncharacterized protein n=1 Tax=Hyalomma asiaticum TaxID=266040 RepID=A0ACB7SMZ7_HYAAI|nr:hypothetical protein HPB50_024733 [Hyalomma asiaticum]
MKTTCFKEQYGNITDERLKVKLNGKKTVGENIADNGGIHQAYHAYRAWAKKHKVQSLPGLQNFTADQLFFISVAMSKRAFEQHGGVLKGVQMSQRFPNVQQKKMCTVVSPKTTDQSNGHGTPRHVTTLPPEAPRCVR